MSDSSDALNRLIDDLEISIRSSSLLRDANITFVGDLVQLTAAQLLKQRGFGKKSLREITNLLGGMGLSLGMEVTGWRRENAVSSSLNGKLTAENESLRTQVKQLRALLDDEKRSNSRIGADARREIDRLERHLSIAQGNLANALLVSEAQAAHLKTLKSVLRQGRCKHCLGRAEVSQ